METKQEKKSRNKASHLPDFSEGTLLEMRTFISGRRVIAGRQNDPEGICFQ